MTRPSVSYHRAGTKTRSATLAAFKTNQFAYSQGAELVEARKGCLILCITDTHIQNLYNQLDDLISLVIDATKSAYQDGHRPDRDPEKTRASRHFRE